MESSRDDGIQANPPKFQFIILPHNLTDANNMILQIGEDIVSKPAYQVKVLQVMLAIRVNLNQHKKYRMYLSSETI